MVIPFVDFPSILLAVGVMAARVTGKLLAVDLTSKQFALHNVVSPAEVLHVLCSVYDCVASCLIMQGT